VERICAVVVVVAATETTWRDCNCDVVHQPVWQVATLLNEWIEWMEALGALWQMFDAKSKVTTWGVEQPTLNGK
jgi:hypothetical protein